MMKNANRTLAFLAYLIPVIVPLYIILLRSKDGFARYHAYQSLSLCAAALIVPLVWAIAAWAMVWIPLVGALLSAASFALVIGAYLAIVVGWFYGMTSALQALVRPVPLFGGWGERFLT
ncbi:MAG: hypothetical protein KF893_06710 [Caldilineaceae bacterium]|nr:hypothetical protein [Caldilineaceae bacterium]